MTDKQHSVLSPSGAKRWITCPGSLWLCKGVKNTESEASKEGTLAHELADYCFKNSIKPIAITDGIQVPKFDDLLGDIEEFYPIEDEMKIHIQDYYHGVKELTKDCESVCYEKELDLSEVYQVDGQFGTCDVSAVNYKKGILRIIDLKYGAGVFVHAVNNPQLTIYALGVYMSLSPETQKLITSIEMHICQPRIPTSGGIWRSWTISALDLTKQLREIRAAAMTGMKCHNSVEMPSTFNFHPSDEGCKFCPKKADCEFYVDDVSRSLEVDFFSQDSVETAVSVIPQISNERLATVYPILGRLEDLIKEYRKQVFYRLKGELSPDDPLAKSYKLVQGKAGNRKWENEKEVEAELKRMKFTKDEMYKISVISPSVAEKLCKKKNVAQRWSTLEQFITRKDGEPTIAAIDDPRPAINTVAQIEAELLCIDAQPQNEPDINNLL